MERRGNEEIEVNKKIDSGREWNRKRKIGFYNLGDI